MTITDYPMVHSPELTEAQFVGLLGGYPPQAEARAMYRTLVAQGVSVAVFLGMFWVESKYGTQGVAKEYATHNPGNVRTPEDVHLGIQTPEIPGKGRYASYATWAAGTLDWCLRIKGPKYAGAGLLTVRQVLPKYAPKSDSNDPVKYGDSVLAAVEKWGSKGGSVALNIIPKLTNVNIWVGRQGHKPEALVMHVAEGGKGGVDSWFHNPSSEASAHYLVNKDGSIWQFVREEDTAWANGKTNNPNRADPLINAWLNAGINPNRKTISIETEGFWNQDMTPEQLRSVAALAADIHQRYGWPTDGSRLFGHNEFDAVDRARCPSFSRAEWDTILAAVKGGKIVVEKKPIVEIDPGFPGALNEQGELVVNGVNMGGRADAVVKAVFTVYNAAEQRYYAIEWAGHQVGPWKDA